MLIWTNPCWRYLSGCARGVVNVRGLYVAKKAGLPRRVDSVKVTRSLSVRGGVMWRWFCNNSQGTDVFLLCTVVNAAERCATSFARLRQCSRLAQTAPIHTRFITSNISLGNA